MADPLNQSPVAIPVSKSPISVSTIVSIISTLALLFPILKTKFGLSSPDEIAALANSAYVAIGLGVTLVSAVTALIFRIRSKIQPVTLTQAGADKIAAAAPASVPASPPPAKQAGFADMRLLLTIVILTAVAGCAALGLTQPKGFDQSLAEAYGVHTAVLSATATALTAGTITSAEATVVNQQAQNARLTLDTARGLEGTNPAAAANDLTLATNALTAIQKYLNAQGKK